MDIMFGSQGREVVNADDQRTATFYSLVHHLVEVTPPKRVPQRRRQKRHAFSALCQIAPYQGAETPREDDFFAVRCRDLNQNGFSFLLPKRPAFTSLLAALGEPPAQIFMAADITQCHDVWIWPTGEIEPIAPSATDAPPPRRQGVEPERAFHVGCQFVRRVSL
jgi:hypothetical protein